MADPYSDPSQPRRQGFFRRLVSRMLGEDPRKEPAVLHPTTVPAPVLPVTATTNTTVPISFTTPAKGDAYDFHVTAELCFCATGLLPHEQLDLRTHARIPGLVEEIKAAARPIARQYPPFRPGAVEPLIAEKLQQTVTEALVGAPDAEGVMLSCTVRTRVDMAPELREIQRQFVAEQMRFEARYEQSEQSAQRLGELRDVWTKFIRDGLPHWETPYAVRMAQQPGQVSAVLFDIRRDRKAEAAKLVDTVAAVAAGHERMDLLDFSLATDRALRKTFTLLGIALPPDGPESLFAGSETGEPSV